MQTIQELAYETVRKNFMKNPTSINRTTAKENKIYEYKFQIILRLELSWVYHFFSNSILILIFTLFFCCNCFEDGSSIDWS